MISLEKSCQYDTPDIFIASTLVKPLCESGDIEGWETDDDSDRDGEDW